MQIESVFNFHLYYVKMVQANRIGIIHYKKVNMLYQFF